MGTKTTKLVSLMIESAKIRDHVGLNWAIEHNKAVTAPKEFELPIVSIFNAIQKYCRQHEAAYGSPIGDDSYLGENAIVPMIRGLLAILNGNAGRLDCGAVDKAIRQLATEHLMLID